MGLFSTLTGSSTATSSSSELPTVLQMYTTNHIQLEETSKVYGYSVMTYQAIQVGSLQEEVKNRHVTPDLGVWSCRVREGDNKQPLVDGLLSKVAKDIRTFCWTVDLTEAEQVEPTISLVQGALVRHLIENSPSDPEDSPARQTATTSLYDLQSTQFGLANDDDKPGEKNYSENYKKIKTTLMICALMPMDESHEVSETAFKKKQAQALVMYHLRKYAAALNCSLCFVRADPPEAVSPSSQPVSPSKESHHAPTAAPSSEFALGQPTVNYDKLSLLWRDLALDQVVWETEEFEEVVGEDSVPSCSSTALFGPGRHQEDLIESVLLRNAHYPGHWDASKDSLWVALPTPSKLQSISEQRGSGDQGWLGQLRESIASAADVPVAPTLDKPAEEDKPKEKDAAVSSFFESLLKNP